MQRSSNHPNGAAIGPVDGLSDRASAGHLEAAAGVLARRGPSAEVALLGDILDPLCRSLASSAGLSALAAAGPSASAAEGFSVTPPGLFELAAVEEVVRRVAWGGDRRSGVARIELGGAHLGTSIVVRGTGREVALSIEVAHGADVGELPARLVERLKARGLDVTELEVV